MRNNEYIRENKYVIPKNYDVKTKFLGIVEYSSILYLVIFDVLIYFLLNLVIKSIIIKIQVLILVSTPIILFMFIGINGENINYVIYYFFRYIFKEKVHIYIKSSDRNSKNIFNKKFE